MNTAAVAEEKDNQAAQEENKGLPEGAENKTMEANNFMEDDQAVDDGGADVKDVAAREGEQSEQEAPDQGAEEETKKPA